MTRHSVCWAMFFVLNMVLGIAFTIIVMLFLDPILYFFGGSDQTVGYARDYMQIILLGNAVTHLYLGLNAVLRSSGHPQKAMYATIATVVINTILDRCLSMVLAGAYVVLPSLPLWRKSSL